MCSVRCVLYEMKRTETHRNATQPVVRIQRDTVRQGGFSPAHFCCPLFTCASLQPLLLTSLASSGDWFDLVPRVKLSADADHTFPVSTANTGTYTRTRTHAHTYTRTHAHTRTRTHIYIFMVYISAAHKHTVHVRLTVAVGGWRGCAGMKRMGDGAAVSCASRPSVPRSTSCMLTARALRY